MLLTASVLAVNVVLDVPPRMVTLAGTTAFGLLLNSAITDPPEPARPFNVTVPFAAVPPSTVVGVTVMDRSVATLIVRIAEYLLVP